MLRLIRLVLLCGAAFVAGVFFERGNARDTCNGLGEWRDGLCIVPGQSTDVVQ
ncbi:MAG: hypothetical protein AAGA28_19120 [Pseudomonadota bacterium]